MSKGSEKVVALNGGYLKAEGKWRLPGAEKLVEDLYLRQGDLLAFLKDKGGVSEASQRELLFECLYVLKGEVEQEKRWNMLQDIYRVQQVQMASAKLLNAIVDKDLVQSKPEKVLAVLERLEPERWAKRSVNSKVKADKNTYQDHLEKK